MIGIVVAGALAVMNVFPLARRENLHLVPVVHGLERAEAAATDPVRERGMVALANPAAENVNRHCSCS